MIHREQNRNPTKFTGRQLFVRELNEQADKLRGRGRILPKAFQEDIIAKHGKQWRKAPPHVRDDYEARAISARVETCKRTAERRQDLIAKRRKLQERIADEQGPTRVSQCKFSDLDKREMELAFESFPLSRTELDALRRSRSHAVGPPPANVRQALEGMKLDTVALFRKDFNNVVFSDEWSHSFGASVRVLQGTVSLGGGVLASGSVWKDLSACVDLTIDYGAASDRDPQAKSKSEQIQSDVEAYSWPDCPWLFSLFEASANGGKVDASSRPHGHVQVADTNVDDVMDALNVAREYWALQAPPQENDFKWRLLGGKWTADHTNVCYDAFSGYAATA
eukprot:CAMPEP_0169179212 /NCGR_PEP_ID=MMETSP1015-20121227/67519_1 /TAXON_ID=342587 /ORGANISM="Karlodinium micrum, Strain CCMP2283" /LENGTH=335 /DNA_ID=CAMNT_0009254243 /DNA_START=12 /DNA_END=1017 /DNA_ORIENTATION=-